MIDDIEDDECEDMEFVYMSPAELRAAQGELNRIRAELLAAVAREVNAR